MAVSGDHLFLCITSVLTIFSPELLDLYDVAIVCTVYGFNVWIFF